MRDVSDSLAGRVAVLELLPFAFEELQDRTTPTATEQIWRGGYPPVVLNPESRELWLRSYLSTYLERDVRQLQNIRDLAQFQSFITLCAAAHGQELNLARLSRQCGVSQPCARQWLGVLAASYVVQLVPPLSQKPRETCDQVAEAVFRGFCPGSRVDSPAFSRGAVGRPHGRGILRGLGSHGDHQSSRRHVPDDRTSTSGVLTMAWR